MTVVKNAASRLCWSRVREARGLRLAPGVSGATASQMCSSSAWLRRNAVHGLASGTGVSRTRHMAPRPIDAKAAERCASIVGAKQKGNEPPRPRLIPRAATLTARRPTLARLTPARRGFERPAAVARTAAFALVDDALPRSRQLHSANLLRCLTSAPRQPDGWSRHQSKTTSTQQGEKAQRSPRVRVVLPAKRDTRSQPAWVRLGCASRVRSAGLDYLDRVGNARRSKPSCEWVAKPP